MLPEPNNQDAQLRKQEEWNEQVLSTTEPYQQVGRPTSEFAFRALADDIRKKLQIDGQLESCLDVGCGNAALLALLASDFRQVTGTDYAQTMVDEAKKNLPAGTFMQAEAAELPVESHTFSRVVCYSIFHYFPDDAYGEKALGEMVRASAAGGVILIGDILDKTHETTIKGNSDPEIEKTLPTIHRYSQWRFFDLECLCDVASRLPGVRNVEILEQPADFQLRHYRKDMRICLA